ncbi:putative sulfate exporter family transporter [Rhodobacteraceae bacterium D3-12]|nr:putative sulfate exporter family transporter [Rhodobacteraceae bacterium D3-12]
MRAFEILPGFVLSAAIGLLAVLAAEIEKAIFGAIWLEPLVLAILIGAVFRTLRQPHKRFLAGIAFSSKVLLEIAIVLLGAAVSAQTLMAVEPTLLTGIVAIVILVVPGSYFLGRLMGLPARMALLIACGNGICGNSAIAAVAPVINANSDDISASITFTAVLGVFVVLGLPLIGHLAELQALQYGVLSGMTVYAVPQVLAAAAPMGAAAVQIGTLVKLVRVLMLGPITTVLAILASRLPDEGRSVGTSSTRKHGFVPPLFIFGFLGMIGLRSIDAIPQGILPIISMGATVLTIIAMAAFGLNVDARSVLNAGTRVIATVLLSLALLIGLGLGMIALLVP